RADWVQLDCFAIEFDCSIHVSACDLEVGRSDHNIRIGRSKCQGLAYGLSRRVPFKIEIRLDRRPGEQPVRQVRLNDKARATASRALAKCASKPFCPPSVENAASQRFVCATPAHARANPWSNATACW